MNDTPITNWSPNRHQRSMSSWSWIISIAINYSFGLQLQRRLNQTTIEVKTWLINAKLSTMWMKWSIHAQISLIRLISVRKRGPWKREIVLFRPANWVEKYPSFPWATNWHRICNSNVRNFINSNNIVIHSKATTPNIDVTDVVINTITLIREFMYSSL